MKYGVEASRKMKNKFVIFNGNKTLKEFRIVHTIIRKYNRLAENRLKRQLSVERRLVAKTTVLSPGTFCPFESCPDILWNRYNISKCI